MFGLDWVFLYYVFHLNFYLFFWYFDSLSYYIWKTPLFCLWESVETHKHNACYHMLQNLEFGCSFLPCFWFLEKLNFRPSYVRKPPNCQTLFGSLKNQLHSTQFTFNYLRNEQYNSHRLFEVNPKPTHM